MDAADATAIKNHLREKGIRGCSTCGETNLEPVVEGYLTIEPLHAEPSKQRVVFVACTICGRVLLFAADAIAGLEQASG
jgi:hypothetical protein